MDNINWKEFEFIDYKVNRKTNKKYYQQYLKPCWYIDLNFRWTNREEMLRLYDEIILQLGHHFRYHHSNSQSSETKLKDKEKAFLKFHDFWNSKDDYLWRTFSNIGGIGTREPYGGVGDAAFSCWIHKSPYDEKTNTKQVAKYISRCKEYDSECLVQGAKISTIEINLPINDFVSPDDFFKWFYKIVKPLTLFSGTAGIRMNQHQGYANAKAQDKLIAILEEYPGFDYDFRIGNTLGTVLNKDKSHFLPLLRRLNWLNIIETKAIEELGGLHYLKSKDIGEIITIDNGIVFKTSPNPVLKKGDLGLKKYTDLKKLLDPILYGNRYSGYQNTGIKIDQKYLNWFNAFDS